ncbi:MAG: hypothetical protein GVY04_14540 [Cyanobacteria bacterium]|jgi:hypothetical protein|nr:hypothetical protein [Cyanobacteria bacterium GSL.Bin1]
MAIATQDNHTAIFLLIINNNSEPREVKTVIPSFDNPKKLTIWEFSSANLDSMLEENYIEEDSLFFEIPAQTSQ